MAARPTLKRIEYQMGLKPDVGALDPSRADELAAVRRLIDRYGRGKADRQLLADVLGIPVSP